MIPTCGDNGGSDTVNALVIPNNDSKIIVTVHNYSPYDFCLNQTGTTSWSGTSAEKSALDSEFDVVYNKFVVNGRGVVIGEFGSLNKNNTSARAAHAGYVATALKSRNITPIVWDNGATGSADGSMGLFNRSTLTWTFGSIADAITSPFNGGGGGGGAVANGTYKIISRHSLKAMDAAGAALPTEPKSFSGLTAAANNQRWTVTDRGNDQYSIIGVQAAEPLKSAGWGTANGTKVQLWDWQTPHTTRRHLHRHQRRLLPDHSIHLERPVPVWMSRVSRWTDGALVHLWTYGGGNNQQWSSRRP